MQKLNQNKGNEKKDRSLLLALLFFAVAGILVLYAFNEPSRSSVHGIPKTTAEKQKYEDRVNRHLMLTNEKIQLQKQSMVVDNQNLAPEYSRTKGAEPMDHEVRGVDLSTDTHAADVAAELGRAPRSPKAPGTPDETIQSEIFNEQQEREYSAAYKAEYARQFVQNARKSGWEVKLTSDYKVLSVKPLRKPGADKESIFSEGPGWAQ